MPIRVDSGSSPYAEVASKRLTGRMVLKPHSPARILIVDDDVGMREATAALLTLESFDVRVAMSGMEAIDTLRAWVPDVVVLDIQLPVYDGFEVATVLRSVPSTAEVPVIAATAYDLSEVMGRGAAGHFDAIFRKGDDGSAFTMLVRSFFDPETTRADRGES